jgi:hypothetical protein
MQVACQLMFQGLPYTAPIGGYGLMSMYIHVQGLLLDSVSNTTSNEYDKQLFVLPLSISRGHIQRRYLPITPQRWRIAAVNHQPDSIGRLLHSSINGCLAVSVHSLDEA